MTALPRRLLEAAGGRVEHVFRAPGRANLIGEHTDYNEGFVLPVALDLSTYVAGVAGGRAVSLTSLDEPGEVVVAVADGRGPMEGWGRYVTAVVRALLDESIQPRGFSGVLSSDVPRGAGLSSSAALEVAVAFALLEQHLEPVGIARICRRAENDYVGVRSGIMDPLASAAGRRGSAVLIDCRSETTKTIPLPEHLCIVVIDSGVRRALSGSAYNDRRAQCEYAAERLGVRSLRDTDIDLLEAHRNDLGGVVFRRARHVVSENQRVLAAVEALKEGDRAQLGRLFAQSHDSLRADYEVSTPELDVLVGLASETSGVIGARLTGAGFGGCSVQLVEEGRAEDAAGEIAERYRAATGRTARFWVSRAADGAGGVPL